MRCLFDCTLLIALFVCTTRRAPSCNAGIASTARVPFSATLSALQIVVMPSPTFNIRYVDNFFGAAGAILLYT